MKLPELRSLSESAVADLRRVYDGACADSGGDIEKLPARKQRSAVRRLKKVNIYTLCEHGIPASGVSAGELCAFLKQCADSDKERGLALSREFEDALEYLPDEVASAFHGIYDPADPVKRHPCFELTCARSGGEIDLLMEYRTAYELRVFAGVLEWRGAVPADGKHEVCLLYLRRADGCFEAGFREFGREGPAAERFTVRFANTNAECRTFRAFTSDPGHPIAYYSGAAEWAAYAACAVFQKTECGLAPINEKERALLPLARELKAVMWSEKPENGFPVLTKAAEEYGLPALRDILKAASKQKLHADGFRRAVFDFLRRAECEPLVMSIIGDIAESQKEYPLREEDIAEAPAAVRETVQSRLYEWGWEGCWPDYKKRVKTKGCGYTGDYFGKTHRFCAGDAVCHIRFVYELDDESDPDLVPTLSAYCGTRIIVPGEPDPGFASCMFYEDDRRMFRSARTECGPDADKLPGFVSAAAKLAELKPLSEDEKKYTTRIFRQKGPAARVKDFFLGAALVYLLILAGELIIASVLCGIASILFDGLSGFDLRSLIAPMLIIPAAFCAALLAIYYGFNLFVKIRRRIKSKNAE